MNLAKFSAIVCGILAIALFVGCDAKKTRDWIHPDLSKHLTFAHTQQLNDLTVWRGPTGVLQLKNDEARDHLLEVFKQQPLVMISYKPKTDFASIIESYDLIYGKFSGEEFNSALLAIPNELTAEGLANAAHAASGHICGSITPLFLNGVAPIIENMTPAIHNETVNLPSVNTIIREVSEDNLLNSIKKMESLETRFHSTDTGISASNSVKNMMSEAILGNKSNISIEEIDHKSSEITIKTRQKSLILSIPGQSDDTTTVILGAHLDSINKKNEIAPGADDDASGIATLIEIARILNESGAKFQRRIELHAYAAEEVGLVGSQNIATEYKTKKRIVSAMMQFDMNSWSSDPSKQTIYLVKNDTHVNLRRSVKDILNNYLDGDFQEKVLTGGTSDHKSWIGNGYPTIFPFENPEEYNPRLHTSEDTSKQINNLKLSKRFTQLGVAFIAHHAGIIDESSEKSSSSLKDKKSDDLKLAILPTDQKNDQYAISVSAPLDVEFIEFCLADSSTIGTCKNRRVLTSKENTNDVRKFFIPDEPVALSNGTKLAVFAYDSKDRLISFRNVRLQKK